MFHKLRARIALATLLLAISVGAHSSFHLWTINEVYSNANGTVQFIEMTVSTDGQEFLQGASIRSTQGGNTNSFTFPNPLGNYSGPRTFLIGTTGFAALNVVTPDYIVPNGFVFIGNNMTINFSGGDFVTFMAPIPTDGTLSINRNFATAINSPTNFFGVTGTVMLTNPTPPGAPTNVTAVPGNGQATISFTPGSAGSSPITSFNATCGSNFGSTGMGSALSSPIVVMGLSNGQPYLCSVTATNANGTSPSASVNVTPAAPVTVPGAPTINFISAGNGQATINFSPPTNNGGAALGNYIATCGTATSSGLASPLIVFGLTNGTTFSCTVAATNSAGTGPQSTPVNVTSGMPPGTPNITGAVPGNAQATISFTTPTDGGSPISSYGVSCNSGQASATGSGSPITVGGLVNGTSYACTVTASNSFGPGAASAPVNVTPFTVPGAPTIGAATAGNTVASIAFTPPASNGGSVITGFTATCNPGAIAASGSASPINFTGLVNGTVYTCSVTAANAAGTGTASGSVSVIPATVPGAPTIGTPVAGDGRGAVFFTPPASNGGSAVISYTASCGAFTATGPASPITVTGLANNSTFACSVIATNAVGDSTASATANVTPSASAPLTPIAVLARKIHGGAGTFDLPVDTAPLISGAVTVEPRNIGSGHTLVFQFNVPVTATGTAAVTPVGVVSAVISGFDVVVTLTNVADNQRATISLTDVNGVGVNVAASLGFLVGDVNNTRSVNSSDISSVKARSGQTTTGLNFRFDINASGAVNSSDISAVKARSGLVLP